MAKNGIETVVCNFNARKLAECGGIIRNRMQQKIESKDFAKLELGFDVPENYLMVGSSQPNLADLTVISAKLGLQIRVTSIELVTSEHIEAENAATHTATQAAAKTAGK